MPDDQPKQDPAPQQKRERDQLETLKEACMLALFRWHPTAAAIAVAYVLMLHGNRRRFQKERRFLVFPGRVTLMRETALPNGTLADGLNWLQRNGFCKRPEDDKRAWEIDIAFPEKIPVGRNKKIPVDR